MVRVFVYGTLMRGHANHRVLVALGARRIGEAATAAPRTLVDLGPYPALLAGAPTDATPVTGELYEIEDSALDELDAFEGCPDPYRRERIALAGDLEAWTYVLAGAPPSHATMIGTGRYAGSCDVSRRSATEIDGTR